MAVHTFIIISSGLLLLAQELLVKAFKVLKCLAISKVIQLAIE